MLPMASLHSLGRGLQGYLTLFAPHAFVRAASGKAQLTAFAFGVPHDLNGYHPYTVRSINLYLPQVAQSLMRFHG